MLSDVTDRAPKLCPNVASIKQRANQSLSNHVEEEEEEEEEDGEEEEEILTRQR